MTATSTRSVPIDPRIHERRIAVRREVGRRRARLALVAGALFVVVVGAYLLVQSPLLDVDHIRVVGTERVRAEDVIELSAVERGAPLLSVDLSAVEDRVQTLAWVDGVRVVRDWPGTLRIEVTEFEPAAYVRRDARSVALISEDGRVVSDARDVPVGAVEVRGVRNVPQRGELLSPPGIPDALSALPERLASRVEAIDLSRNSVALALIGGGEIRLGALDDIPAKSAAALAVLDRLDGARFEYIDVRVPSAPVARTS